MISVDEINKLKEENKKIIKRLSDFADKFDNIYDYVNTLEVRSEDEEGYRLTEEDAIYGDNLIDLEKLLKEFVKFVEEVE